MEDKAMQVVQGVKPNMVNWIGAAIGAALAWWTGLPPLAQALLIVQGADIVTGLLCAVTGKSRKTESGKVSSGALLMGFGASSLVLGSLADALIQNPAVGWRAAFLAGALPALYAAYLRLSLPESPRWHVARGRAAEAEARASAEDPLFPGLTPDEAWERAGADAEAAGSRPKTAGLYAGGILLLAVGAVGLIATLCGTLPLPLGGSLPAVLTTAGVSAALAIGGAALLIAAGLWKRRFAAGAAELLARYGAERPEDILGRASAYREACVVAAEAAKKREAVEQALAGHIARDEETRRRLLELVHPFAPTVTDTFGVSAALSRALNLDERLSTARVKLEGARTLADSLPRPEEVSGGTDVEPRFDPAETAARLSAAEGELSRLRSGLAMAQGELNTLGDREALQTRREAIQEELDRRRAEYDALGAALAALEQAHSGLQARFSPALNRRAGELLAELTGGKYDKVALTQQFEALAEERDGLQPRRALTLSQGTADQLYLAVRLAVCELVLPAEEPCPLVLDDALANFDDGRCALALEALARLGEERQILLFTCHSREARLAEGREGAAVLRLQS